MESVILLLLALALDLSLGEFPYFIHPVVWMGKVISVGLKFAPYHRGKYLQFIYGTVMAVFTIAFFSIPAFLLLLYLKRVSVIAFILVGAFLLKSSFSIKELGRVALKIKRLLEGDDLNKARREIKALVSRDTQKLNEPHLVSATIESVAENTTDSFVTPLFYFLLLGVPGAIAYRVVNTLDAMIGYQGEYEYLGKFSARLDDGLNFIPARIAALFIVISAYLCQMDGKKAWQIMLRDHAKTKSPNAGWTMSAMAGALRTRLEKIGYYILGNNNSPLSPKLISSAVRIMEITAFLWISLCLIALIFRR